MVAFNEPVPPPSTPEIAAMEVDMDILLLTAGNLTIKHEQSSKSIVALTRELIVRGLPLELARLYASEEVPWIPVHKPLGLGRFANKKGRQVCHKGQCKQCGKLLSRDGKKKARILNTHMCGAGSKKAFAAMLGNGGWEQAFKNLDYKGWKVGPGPHDEADRERYLGKELYEAAIAKNLIAKPTDSGLPSNSCSTKALSITPVKVRSNARTRARKPQTPFEKANADQKAAERAKLQAQRKVSRISPEDVSQAQARARAIILAQTRKQTNLTQTATPEANSTASRSVVSQQLLPVFDIGDLGRQIDSLSLTVPDREPPMAT